MMTTVLALLALGAFTAEPAALEQEVKLGTLAPEGSPWHKIIQDMGEEWKAAAGPGLKFRIFPGGVAGDEPDMVRKLRIGQLHMAALTSVGLAEIAPEIMAIQMPMLLRTDEELDYVRDKIAPRFEKLLLDKGFVVLNWGEAGWTHFFGQKPIVTVADLKGTKLMVWEGNPGEHQAWKAAGVNPVPLAATDMHTGLKSGLINAFTTSALAALSFQWFGSAKEMSDLNWVPLIGATIIKVEKWNALDPKLKPALLASAKTAGVAFRKETRAQSIIAVETMKKHGLTVHTVPPEEVAVWQTQARLAWPALMGKTVPLELVTEIEKLRDELRAQKQQGK
jgi:TRAP-type C4-dicarboxylate transport system substrate-binding protein